MDMKNNNREETSALNKIGGISEWFQTLCFVHIPIIGFIYMLVIALRRSTPKERKHFAIAYILYRMLVMLLVFVVLYVLYKMGLDVVTDALDYMS